MPSSLESKIRTAEVSRLTQLDALRGVAALAVFWSHAFRMFPVSPEWLRRLDRTPFHCLYDGQSAVLLFFVLSGFVLNIKFVQGGQNDSGWAPDFIIRRIFRIYPAFLAAVLVSMVLRFWLFNPAATGVFSGWFSSQWAGEFPWSRLPRLLTLVAPNISADFVSSPLWSLVYEMRVSIFFPLIILGVNRKREGVWDGCLLLGACLGCFFLARMDSFLYLPHFILGAFCAKYFAKMRGFLARWPVWSKTAWLIASVVLYELPVLIAPQDTVFSRPIAFVLKLGVGIGAAGLILGAGSFARLGDLFNREIFQFLGRASYSFYLLHIPFLLALAPLIFNATHSWLAAWGASLVISYLVAILLYKICEVPGIRLGSRFLKRFHSGQEAKSSKDVEISVARHPIPRGNRAIAE